MALPDISSGVIALPNNVGAGGGTVPFDFRRGYIHSYNLTLQREFAGFVGEAGNNRVCKASRQRGIVPKRWIADRQTGLVLAWSSHCAASPAVTLRDVR